MKNVYFVFLAVIGMNCVTAYSDDIMVNGDFEVKSQGDPGWIFYPTGTDTMAFSTVDSQNVFQSVVTSVQGRNDAYGYPLPKTVTEGDGLYQVTFDYKTEPGFTTPNPSWANIVSVSFYDTSWASLWPAGFVYASITDTNGQWVTSSTTVTQPPANAAYVLVEITTNNDNDSDGTLYIDNVVLEKTQIPVVSKDLLWYFPLDDPDQDPATSWDNMTRNQAGPGCALIMDKYQQYRVGDAIVDAWDSNGKFGGCLDGYYGSNSGNNYSGTPIIARIADAHFPEMEQLTIAFWMKYRNPARTDTDRLLHASGSEGNKTLYFDMHYWDTSNPANPGVRYSYFEYAGGDGRRTYERSLLSDGNWHHVALVVDLTKGAVFDQAEIYIDGNPVSSTTYKDKNATQTSLRIETFDFCGLSNLTMDKSFEGWMDEFRIYNRALSAAEVIALKNHVPSTNNQAQWNGPRNGSTETDGWKLYWNQGNGTAIDYDVYLGTALENDYNRDGEVDMDDVLVLAESWLDPGTFTYFADMAGEWLDTAFVYQTTTSSESFDYGDLTEKQRYAWRIDKDGVTTGQPWFFDVIEPWSLSEFVIGLGWSSLHRASSAPGDLETNCRAYAQEMADLGINLIYEGPQGRGFDYYNWAHDAGLKTLVYVNKGGNIGLEHCPASYADGLKDHPSVWGYLQHDEPERGEGDDYAQFIRQTHWADPTKPSLINFESIYNHGGWNGSDVDAYVAAENYEIISFDFYNWYWGQTGGSNSLIRNLNFFQDKAISEDAVLMSWVEVDAYGSGSSPSSARRDRYRYSVYLNLVYGAKGIFWFSSGKIFDDNGVIEQQGYYDDVQTINNELTNLGPELIPLSLVAVYHSGIGNCDYDYSPVMDAVPVGSLIQISGGDGFALGMFENEDGNDYAMVMNRDYQASHTALISFTQEVSQVHSFDAANGTWSALTINGSFPNQSVNQLFSPGQGKLLRVITP